MDTSGTDGRIVSKGELAKLAEDALNKIPEAMDSGDEKSDKKPVKILFFEIDPGILGYFQSVYNVVADFLAHVIAPRTFYITRGVLGSRGAAVASLGVDVTLKSGDYVRQVFSVRHDQYQQKQILARNLASVLDEVKGSHSVAALLSVKPAENAMIYAQCKRLAKQHEAANLGKYVDLLVNAGPNIAMSIPRFYSFWTHGMAHEEYMRSQPATEDGKGLSGELKTMLSTLINATVPAIATKWKDSEQKKLKRKQQPSSALEMILKLEEELIRNPKASAFAAPTGESHSLEEYVARIIIQHSRDMAEINPEYNEIRKALKADLEALAKPIAEAIAKGDLAPLTLVRWIGEGAIVKDNGRKLAKVGEVEKLLGTAEKRPKPPVSIDPKEYYMDAAFNQRDLQKALGTLKGEERSTFAAMFPDSVLTQAGMKDEEIKAIRQATLNTYEKMLAEAIAGLAMKSDEALEKDGLAKEEIKQLREAHEAMKSKGLAAVHEARTTHANVHGIERTLTNWAVPRVKGGVRLGTILHKGREELAATPTPAPQPEADKVTDPQPVKQKVEEADSHVAAIEQQATNEMAAEPAR